MDSVMFDMGTDQRRAKQIGKRIYERRERDGLSLAQVARETGVSAGTIKRFEQFAMQQTAGKPFRYEPWGAEYLERWLDGTLTQDIIIVHDVQRMLERDSALTREQVRKIVSVFKNVYDRERDGSEE